MKNSTFVSKSIFLLTFVSLLLFNLLPSTASATVPELWVAPDGSTAARFGRSVSVSGDVAAVSLVGEDSVYIYRQQLDSSWDFEHKISRPSTEPQGNYGEAIAISGDWIVVGASGNDELSLESGAAYLYQHQADGSWVYKQKFLSPYGQAYDYFGVEVALLDDVLAVGAQDAYQGPGAVYFYRLQADDTWELEQKIVTLDREAYDSFGFSISLNSGVALIGAETEGTTIDGIPYSARGCAYVYRYQANRWEYEDKIILPVELQIHSLSGTFGSDVSLYGDVALIGSNDDWTVASHAGAAYIYRRNGNGEWVFEQQLLPFDGLESGRFGESVSLFGDVAVVGSLDSWVASAGAYIFRRGADGVWHFVEKFDGLDDLPLRTDQSDVSDVSLSGDTLLIGGDGYGGIYDPVGAAYMFDLDDGDGVAYAQDNCVSISNPLQTDFDSDSLGDACDDDDDGDGVGDNSDTCPLDADNDIDGDGICGDIDLCPAYSNDLDADSDGLADCLDEGDTDGDSFTDMEEVACGSDPADPLSRCSASLPWLMLLLEDE